jgi:N-acetylmuramoyl-L-alanine amidase
MGHEVMLTRDRDVFVPINARAMTAKLWKADVLVSVHTNADADDDMPGKPAATGSEIWTWPGSVEGKQLAECIAKRLTHHLPDRKWRGIKQEDFGVLRQIKASALVEVGFIDTESSYKLTMAETQIMIAKIIAEGVDAYGQGHKFV